MIPAAAAMPPDIDGARKTDAACMFLNVEMTVAIGNQTVMIV
jgi:hypothetical protein